ncbi:MAG: hypothetical protein B0W54_10290 [Cellvibrio sp. 79]|nr:MAG: hypothetical protein B0W54_10290 [Cellvibrio sp. 79]
MNDIFTEVTRTSWSNRIGKSIKGVATGILLVLVCIGLLFWNEGRAVKTHKALIESQGAVVSINAQEDAPQLNGKLVHISGQAASNEILADTLLPVTTEGLKLQRFVETYQWKETSHSEERKTLGGDTETVTTYQYEKVWSSELIKSSGFKNLAGHQNPGEWVYKTQIWTANQIDIGNYRLSNSHKNLIDNFQHLPVPEGIQLTEDLKKLNGQLYAGKNPKKPAIGDQRIQFNFIPAQTYSAIGDLNNNEIHEHIASNGHVIVLLQAGSYTANAMFEKAKSDNVTLTWALRLVGSVLLIVAFSMILKPLSVLADVVPLAGNIVEIGTGLVSFLLGSIVALVTIGIAWIFYRPLLGLALLVIVGALVYWLKRKSFHAAKTITENKPVSATSAYSDPTASK